MSVVAVHSFRVTRNEDLEVEEDDAENLLQALEKELLRRRFGPAVRLEVASDIDQKVRELLVRELGVTEQEVYELPEPLDLRGLGDIADIDRQELKFPKFVARTHRDLTDGAETAKPSDVFAAIRNRDVLLHHPYDSFSTSVQAFLEQAAADPKVLAIKQTLYRTSGDSPIVDALIEAAQAGKQVLALVEIKARFDEQANIAWARKLEKAGVLAGGFALTDPEDGTSVTRADAEAEAVITAGPYAESREFVGGTIVLDVPSLDEALAWAAKCPGAIGGRVEVRPMLEL